MSLSALAIQQAPFQRGIRGALSAELRNSSVAMSTFVAHAVSAYAMTRVGPAAFAQQRAVLLAAMACACAPDLDVIAFAFGIPYNHLFGHRGISHSLLFAALLGALVAAWLGRRLRLDTRMRLRLFGLLFVATASHGLFDAMTNGGLGIAFFAPFDAGRYFLPWRPLVVPPIGVLPMFSPWGAAVVKTELLYIGLPSLVLIVTARLFRRRASVS